PHQGTHSTALRSISCKLTIEKFPRPSLSGLETTHRERAMKIRYHFNSLPLLVLLGAVAADAQVKPQLAKQYFEEATKLCERDAGGLWGVSLCGPMVIGDPSTGTRATSQPEPEGQPPRFPGGVDGPVTWGGLRWFYFPLSMLASTDADVRQQNMLHGLFHRI